jgi:glucokinase
MGSVAAAAAATPLNLAQHAVFPGPGTPMQVPATTTTTTSKTTVHILAGDIGGTNARLVLYEAPADPNVLLNVCDMSSHRVVAQMYYKNNDFVSFTEVMLKFTSLPSTANRKIAAACLATAGPVSNNRINFTNREGWIIDGRALEEEFAIDHVLLVNDFVANGYGLLGLDSSEVQTLQHGTGMMSSSTTSATGGGGGATGGGDNTMGPLEAVAGADSYPTASVSSEIVSQAPKALVGAGTGLGECFLTPGLNGLYQAYASEGGHVEFAPRTDLEEELLKYLQAKLELQDGASGGGGGGGGGGAAVADHFQVGDERPRVSVERVVSGKGLENIYEFLRTKFPDEINSHLDGDYNESSERGRLIGSEKYNYSLFMRSLEMMFAIYGGEVGNVALKYLPYGGLYIAGGIAPKNIEFINSPNSSFMRRFLDKGRMRSIMSHFPVHVVMKEDLGLRGAHIVAARLAGQAVKSGAAVPVATLDASSMRADSRTDMLFPRRGNEDRLVNAIHDYPITYAVATSLTAVFTATAIVLGGQLLSYRLKSK